MKSFGSIVFILLAWSTHAQFLSRAAALEDLNLLKAEIIRYNPALKIYHPEFEIEASKLVAQLKSDSVSLFEHFTEISRMCALANEGHFLLGNWQDPVHEGVPKDSLAYLPLQVRILDHQLYIWRDYSNERPFHQGDRIIAIEGVSVDDVLNRMLSLMPADGDIQTYAYRKIESSFNLLYLFHFPQKESIAFEYIDINGDRSKARIKTLKLSEQRENYDEFFSNKNEDSEQEATGFYQLTYHEDYTYWKLPSFDRSRVEKYEVKSKKMYKSLFKEFKEKGVQNLIVDLRDNTGGLNEFADDMVPFILHTEREDPYLKKTISWEAKEREYSFPRRSKHAFEGRIYVLVNGKTFSAGASLARFLKEYADAIVIGTETGTRYDGFAAGSTQYVSLPNCGVSIGIPRYHILYPKSAKQQETNRGLIPDFEIRYGIEDLVNERDLHLEYSLKLIQGEP